MYRPSIHSSTHSFIRPAHHPLRHLPTPVGKRTWAEAHTAGSGRPLKTGRVLFGPRPVSRLRAGGADRFLCVSVTLAKATCFLHLLFKVEHLVVKKIFRPLPFTRGPLRSQLNRVAFQDTHVAFRSSTTSVLNTASKPEVTRTWSKADEHRVPPPPRPSAIPRVRSQSLKGAACSSGTVPVRTGCGGDRTAPVWRQVRFPCPCRASAQEGDPRVLFCACGWLVNWKVLEGSAERGRSPSTEHPRSALLSAAGLGSLSLPPSPQWHT